MWFVFELVIWPQEVTLARWTQPSGPLCLWQCFHWGAVLFSDSIELLAFHLKLFRISWWSHYFAANWPDRLDGAESASRRVSHHRLLHGSVCFSEVISDWRNLIVTCTRYWECWNITRLLACSNLLPGSGLSQTNSSGGTLLYSKKAACSVACVLSNVAWFSNFSIN